MNYIEKENLKCEFLLAPSNKYVGWAVFNNGYYFGSGNNLSSMMHNVKQSLWKVFKSKKLFRLNLATKPTDRSDVPVEKMTDRFKTVSYFNHKIKDTLTKEQAEIHEETKSNVDPLIEAAKTLGVSTIPTESEFVCEEKDGEMIVYELRVYARYKLHKNNLTTTNK